MRVIAPSEARRIEAGIFNYGSDMRVSDTPLHISGLEKYVELDQPHDFLGREAMARLAGSGVDRKLVGVDIGGEPMTDEGALNDFWPVHVPGGAQIGRITAGAWSPRLERNVGYAWVPVIPHGRGHGARGRLVLRHPDVRRCPASVRRRGEADPRGMSDSIAFDRAAEYYDETRGLSEEGIRRTIEVLTDAFAGAGPVLEVGVGTGQVALPLHDAAVDVVGIDLSRAMLARLVAKAGGVTPPFPLIEGDATRMPLRDDAFGGAYLRWVLHLVPDWRAAVSEIARVVAPRGRFLAGLGSYGGRRSEIQGRFAEITGVSTQPIGLAWDGWRDLDDAIATLGGEKLLRTPSRCPRVRRSRLRPRRCRRSRD